MLVSGQDGAGKGETINLLYEWMDPRFLSTLAFADPTDEEREQMVKDIGKQGGAKAAGKRCQGSV